MPRPPFLLEGKREEEREAVAKDMLCGSGHLWGSVWLWPPWIALLLNKHSQNVGQQSTVNLVGAGTTHGDLLSRFKKCEGQPERVLLCVPEKLL